MYDPILALPGVDVEKLGSSIEALKMSQKSYLSFYTSVEQELIIDTLHPFEFLEALPYLEKSRQELLQNPTHKNALHYLALQTKTLELQREYTQKLSDAFILLDRKDFDVVFLPGTTSDAHVSKVLEQVNTTLGVQLDEIHKRKSCLLGWRMKESCEVKLPPIIVVSENDSLFNKSQEILRGEALKIYIHKNRVRHSPTSTESQDLPLVHITQAACTLSKKATYVFTWRPSFASENIGFWTSPTSELLFHDVGRRRTKYEELSANAGTTYAFQPMNPYFCVDNSFDSGRVRTAYFIQDYLTTNPIFLQDVYTFKSTIVMKELEEDIVNQTDVLHTAIIENYIAQAQKLVYDEPYLLSQKDTLALLDLITTWRAQSAWLASEIIRLESMSATSVDVLKTIHIPVSALFMTRAYFSSLLLTNNGTLHRERVSFLENHIPLTDLSKAGIISYDQHLHESISLKELPLMLILDNERAPAIFNR